MATFYLDPEGGNDANDGTTFANRWKTLTSGATAARTAPGDTIRIMAAPAPTSLGQNVTWTNNSKTLTLTSAVTANITDCETAWTASTNVTATANTTTFREGTHSANLAVASAFTTGKIAYFATGALNLSSWQQVSFLARTSIAEAAGVLQLCLCSDTTGDVPVHTINLSATGAGSWTPQVFDNAGALSASIQSVALYAASDPGTVTVNLDNIIACKASSAADAITHASLLGKVHNLYWTAGATYAVGDQRKPTPPNRTGFSYKVTAIGTGVAGGAEPTWPQELGLTVTDGGVTWTCFGPEETWYALASINGTTISLECNPGSTNLNSGGTYQGDTETVLTYKREPTWVVADQATSGSTSTNKIVQEGGSAGLPITYSGGWDRTAMSSQSGETWWDGRTGFGCAIGVTTNTTRNYLTFSNINPVRYSTGYALTGTNNRNLKVEHAHGPAHTNAMLQPGTGVRFEFLNLVTHMNGQGIINGQIATFRGRCLQISGTLTSGGGLLFPSGYTEINYFWYRGNLNNTIGGSTTTAGVYAVIKNLITANASGAVIAAGAGGFDLVSPNFGEGVATAVTAPTAGTDGYITITRAQATAGDHRRITDGGTIVSATDQRHTASGISWKFMPTDTTRGEQYPLRLPLAQIKCAAGVSKTVSIWCYRDNANIKGRLMLRGGWLPGLGGEQYVDCAPTINTWTQSGNLTFTASEDGVVEVEFLVWDGVGTTNNFWIDDISIT